MNEHEQVSSDPSLESSEELIQDYLKQADAAWCLRSLTLIASEQLKGDHEEAIQRLYESSGGKLDATTARCFKSDCNAFARITDLVNRTPENCTTHIDLQNSIAS